MKCHNGLRDQLSNLFGERLESLGISDELLQHWEAREKTDRAKCTSIGLHPAMRQVVVWFLQSLEEITQNSGQCWQKALHTMDIVASCQPEQGTRPWHQLLAVAGAIWLIHFKLSETVSIENIANIQRFVAHRATALSAMYLTPEVTNADLLYQEQQLLLNASISRLRPTVEKWTVAFIDRLDVVTLGSLTATLPFVRKLCECWAAMLLFQAPALTWNSRGSSHSGGSLREAAVGLLTLALVTMELMPKNILYTRESMNAERLIMIDQVLAQALWWIDNDGIKREKLTEQQRKALPTVPAALEFATCSRTPDVQKAAMNSIDLVYAVWHGTESEGAAEEVRRLHCL